MSASRLSYEESCRRLQESYLDPGDVPPIPDRLPQADDEAPLGVAFFQTFVGEGDDLGNLTLPRTYFGNSEINDAFFRNTDFTESNLCWNDFTDVDLSDALLARCDIRASHFTRVKFASADLTKADLRRSSFDECVFDRANMSGAVLTRAQGEGLRLSDEQRAAIAWTDDDGAEPPGG